MISSRFESSENDAKSIKKPRKECSDTSELYLNEGSYINIKKGCELTSLKKIIAINYLLRSATNLYFV